MDMRVIYRKNEVVQSTKKGKKGKSILNVGWSICNLPFCQLIKCSCSLLFSDLGQWLYKYEIYTSNPSPFKLPKVSTNTSLLSYLSAWYSTHADKILVDFCFPIDTNTLDYTYISKVPIWQFFPRNYIFPTTNLIITIIYIEDTIIDMTQFSQQASTDHTRFISWSLPPIYKINNLVF